MLCSFWGKKCAESIFNPDVLDDDVYGIHISGLGRSKNFAFSDRLSLINMDHPVVGHIQDRIHVLMRLIDVDASKAVEVMAAQQRNTDTSHVAEDVIEENIELMDQVNALRKQLEARDNIIADLSEGSIKQKQEYNALESDRDHRLQQVTELLAIVKRNKEKIESLKKQVSDLS